MQVPLSSPAPAFQLLIGEKEREYLTGSRVLPCNVTGGPANSGGGAGSSQRRSCISGAPEPCMFWFVVRA